MNDDTQITWMIDEWKKGNDRAREQLFTVVYDDLRAMAKVQRRKWSGNKTMNTTALVHELYLKLHRSGGLKAKDRAHFYVISAKVLRQVLLDYAKKKNSKKRGGDVETVLWDEALINKAYAVEGQADEIVAIDAALERLERISPRQAQVVELHFFAGLSHEEIGDILEVSTKTVSRDWNKARAWLRAVVRADESRSG